MTGTPRGPIIHLVGSVPLRSAEAVFRRLSAELGADLERLVDGETGRRASWVGFIQRVLREHPAIEEDTSRPPFRFVQWDGKLIREWPYLKLKDGVDPSTVSFETGYAEDAIDSFAIFERLGEEGVIAPEIKYQACAGTPLAIAYLFISPEARKPFTTAYTRHMIAEVGRIAAAIPHSRLSYQWDVAPEVLMWEGYFERPADYKEEILSSLGEIGDAVPATIDLGYHLCYGSPADQHLVQPKDMAILVEIANGIARRVSRPLQYIHMPVPSERSDDAYFRPLDGLRLGAGTALYLGCVHRGDDAGNAEKLARARAHAAVAGVGSECGWGRGDPANLESILAAHKALVESAGP